jgi:hypothetical protein
MLYGRMLRIERKIELLMKTLFLAIVCVAVPSALCQEDGLSAKVHHELEKLKVTPLKGAKISWLVGGASTNLESYAVDRTFVMATANHIFHENGVAVSSELQPGRPYLALLIIAKPVGPLFVMNVSLKLHADAVLTTPAMFGTKIPVAIWETSENLVVSDATQVQATVKTQIEKVVQEFCLDYLRANEP